MKLHTLTILLCLAIGSCGFKPVYQSSEDSKPILPVLSTVKINPVGERFGQILTGSLKKQLNPTLENAETKYFLTINLERQLEPLVIEQNREITRYNIVFKARFDLADANTNAVIYSDVSRMAGSFDAADSEFSVYVAEEDTAERVLRELASDIKLKLTAFFINRISTYPDFAATNSKATPKITSKIIQ